MCFFEWRPLLVCYSKCSYVWQRPTVSVVSNVLRVFNQCQSTKTRSCPGALSNVHVLGGLRCLASS